MSVDVFSVAHKPTVQYLLVYSVVGCDHREKLSLYPARALQYLILYEDNNLSDSATIQQYYCTCMYPLCVPTVHTVTHAINKLGLAQYTCLGYSNIHRFFSSASTGTTEGDSTPIVPI